MKCPKCGSQELRRSALRWRERPRRWFTATSPMRCRPCNWRGWPTYGNGLISDTKRRDPKSRRSNREMALGALLLLALAGIIVGVLSAMAAADRAERSRRVIRPRSAVQRHEAEQLA